MLRPVARGIFNTFVFLWRAPAYSVAGAKPKRASCVQLCVIRKMDGQLDLYQIKFDSLMASYFCNSVQVSREEEIRCPQ